MRDQAWKAGILHAFSFILTHDRFGHEMANLRRAKAWTLLEVYLLSQLAGHRDSHVSSFVDLNSAPAGGDRVPAGRDLGSKGLSLLMLGAVFIFLGPSLILEIAFGNRATVFNDSPTSRPEITSYYQTFRALTEGRPPWRDPQLADFGDRLIPPTMAVPQAIGALFTAPFDERIH